MVLGEDLHTDEEKLVRVQTGQAEVSRGKHSEDSTITQKMYQTMINITHCIEELLNFSLSLSSQ